MPLTLSMAISADDVELPPEAFDLSIYHGSLKKGDHENGKNCWSIPDSNGFRVRSKRFLLDRSKVSVSPNICHLYLFDCFHDRSDVRISHLSRVFEHLEDFGPSLEGLHPTS